MSHKSRAIFLFLTIVAVMLVSAVGTTNVYADDGTPPPPATEETSAVDPSTGEAEPAATEPAVVEPVATEVVVTEPEVVVVEEQQPATEAPVAEEQQPAAEAPVVEEQQPAAEAPVVEEQQPADPAASVLEQVPEDTTVTVLNAEGEAQPLTSQESAEAIQTSDPVWCPSGKLPGDPSCTQPFDSFTELLTFLKANEGNAAYQQEGTIYVQMDNYAGPETSIDFNSYNFASLNHYNLTLQGGWDPIVNDQNYTTTNFNVPILIGTSTNPWIGSLTLNNLSISDVSNQTGLTVYSQADVTLNKVSVTGSLAGADLNAGRDVSIDASTFNGNKKFGANVKAGGLVWITGSDFSYNNIENDAYDGFGLKINTDGEVFADSVRASYNEKYGADITSTAGSVAVLNSFFEGNVSYTHNCSKGVKGCHCTESKNGGYGLQIITKANSAYLSKVEANDNYLFGAHIEALDAQVYNSSFNLNGSDAINNPQGYGLEILTTGTKDVILDGVHADNNQLFGANIAAKGFVAVRNSFFDGNMSYRVSCTYQAKESCHDYVCKTEYKGYGLQVVTTDSIALSTVSAQGNYLFGAHLEGNNVSVFAGTFSGNGSNSTTDLTGKGLEIISKGNASLSNVQANNNQLFGADIQAGGNVAIANSFFNGHKVYEYSGNCSDADKKSCDSQPQPCVKTLVGGGYGLQVVATGSIALSAVQANDNYLFGSHLVGASVAITNGSLPASTFNNNKEGLKIESAGTVTIDKIEANNNTLSGATISAGGKVSIASSFFSGNFSYTSSYCKGKTFYGYGLQVITTGGVVLSGVTADDNALLGAHLEGTDIIISDSSFSSNGTDVLSDHVGKGLEIKSTGAGSVVDLAGVHADNNQLFGANIQAEGNVSIAFSFFSGNRSYYTDCSGKSSSTGGSSGGSSSGGKSGGSKTCHDCKTVYDGYGLQVVTTGNISLNTVKADGNYLYGAHLEGNDVNIGYSTFSENVSPVQQGQTPTGRGLEVISKGNTSLWNVTASKNQLFGADIQAGGQVDITASVFAKNKYTISSSCKGTKTAGYGLKVVATGPIILGGETVEDGIQATENGAEGTILNGQSSVQVSNSTFNGNGASGLDITAPNGPVTLNNVTAQANKVDGVDVKGSCTTTVYVNVNGGNFSNNSKYGIKITDATYVPSGTPAFSGNGSGNVFQNSTCVNTGTGGGNGSGGSNNGGQGWYWWWWWWHQGGHH